MKNNETLDTINNVLKLPEQKTKYLDLIEKRIEEANRNKYKSLIYLIVLFFAFNLIAISKIDGISFEPFEKIDSQLLLYIIPSFFSVCYCYYLISWLHLQQLKNVYSNLISSLFNIEEQSYLNQIANPFDFIHIFEKTIESDNESTLGCLTNLIVLPVLVILVLIPFVFVTYAIILIKDRYCLTFSDTLMISISSIPLFSFAVFILIILKIIKNRRT